jgi:hypothetical protein
VIGVYGYGECAGRVGLVGQYGLRQGLERITGYLGGMCGVVPGNGNFWDCGGMGWSGGTGACWRWSGLIR